MMHREVYTARPIIGDYILSFTGLSWNILRRIGENRALSISTGDRDRKTALERIRTLSEADGSDAWQVDDDQLFRQIVRFRR